MNSLILILNHFASGWLSSIYTMTIQTAVLFLFVFLISWIFRKAPAIFLYYLWVIVLLRFVIFGTFKLPESLRGLFVTSQGVNVLQFASITIEPVQTVASPHLSISAVLFLIWIGGIVILTLKLIMSEKRFYRSLGECREIEPGEKLKSLLQIAAVNDKVRTVIGRAIPAPFVRGIMRPAIYLPAEAENWPEDRFRNSLMHEIAHIKRHDVFAIALQNIISVLYFFNPIVWLTALQLNSQREKACDDFALIKLDQDTEKYGKSLLISLEDGLRQRRYPVMANGLFFPRNIIIKRFDYLYQKGRKIMLSLKSFQKVVLVGVGILAVILACASSSMGSSKTKFVQYDTPPEPIGGFKMIQENLSYPVKAQQAGIEGTVMIKVRIDKSGRTSDLSVVTSSGSKELDDAALVAIKQTQFKPALYKEKPVSVYVSIPVKFSLKEKSSPSSSVTPNTKFVPFDIPPEPIGGFKTIQANLVYPEKAKLAGIEGLTVVEGFVDIDGNFGNMSIKTSSGNDELDAAAITALESTKFKPAESRGEPVGVYIAIPVAFKLKSDNTKIK